MVKSFKRLSFNTLKYLGAYRKMWEGAGSYCLASEQNVTACHASALPDNAFVNSPL